MKKGTNKNRLNGKDLMNVGIFTAINAIGGVLIAVAIGLTVRLASAHSNG